MYFYKNGNYTVCIMDDGTKIRKTNGDKFIPSFSECTDCLITKNCKLGCAWCYEGCTQNGKHGNLLGYKFLENLHPYTEMAINGNDMDHPQLLEFLELLKSKKVFANITVNQNQFMSNLELITGLVEKKLIHGLGVSYNHYDNNFVKELKNFPNAVIHVIHGIITVCDLKKLKGNNFKILILGYKDIRRGSSYLTENKHDIFNNQLQLYDNIETIIKEGWFKVVSFDNLAIMQLDASRLMTDEEWQEFYMGDDGGFTFYINMVDGVFARNSLSKQVYPIGDKSIDEMFEMIKKEV